MQKFENNGIQARPVWKLNHLQKPYLKSQNHQIECAYDLHQRSLCIPSSVGLTKSEINKIIERIRNYL
jgi:perosamine synthetase